MRSSRRERQIKGVVHRTRRMVFRDIQCGEIVEVVLDLRPLATAKPASAKDRFDALQGPGDRMQAAGTPPRPGRLTSTLGGQPRRQRVGLEAVRRR